MSEKRYISLSIMHQGDDKVYLTLFKAIAKQKQFDEEALRDDLKGEDFVDRLHKVKYVLYNFILKKLSSYYWGRSPDTYLNELFIETDILFKKNLIEHAKKRMAKLKALAEENDEYELLLQCYSWERRFSINSAYKLKSVKERDVMLEKELAIIKNLEYISRYYALSDKMYIFVKGKGDVRTKADEEELKKFLNNPLLKKEPSDLLPPAKIIFHFIHMQGYYYLHNFKAALEHVEKYLALLKPRITQNEATLKRYVNGLNNKAMLQVTFKDYDGAFSSLDKMQDALYSDIGKKHLSEEVLKSLQSNLYELRFELYLGSGQFKKGLDYIPTIEAFMADYEGKLEPEYVLILNYLMAYFNFIFANYKKAIYYLNRILNYTKKDLILREDVYCYAKIMYLIAHYEAGTEGLPDYLIKSTYRFLTQLRRLYKIETAILTFIRNKLLKSYNPKHLTKSLEELKESIIEISKDPHENRILDYFDFISWLDSKITRRPFLEVMEEKSKQAK